MMRGAGFDAIMPNCLDAARGVMASCLYSHEGRYRYEHFISRRLYSISSLALLPLMMRGCKRVDYAYILRF